ncbi:MAG TPA: hypothetical protein VGZ49_05695 [Xanthobacteraceae bacterium]|jgi:hypothetical protein|nr:hypothetical protein [Xanthobacteraceae bacterium]
MASISRVAILALLLASGAAAGTGDFAIEEVSSLGAAGVGQLKSNVIVFTDHRKDDLADPATGLIRFEDWARVRPVQKQFLSLYPAYVEPIVDVTVSGVTKPTIEKLQMYVAEARFLVDKPPASIDLARYATLPFLERIDPAISHRLITAADLLPPKEINAAVYRHPDRPWCDPRPNLVCIQSRYQLEGKLPMGVRLVNKLMDSEKKVAEYLEFQSELRVLLPAEIDQTGFVKMTGINSPVTGALEQNIFYVNQILRFGKFLALLQQHPTDADKTVATAYVALAIKAKVLENKKEYETVPILRNLVPAQVLVGNSSFNSGNSISAGLPAYARNQIKAVATILEH